MVFGPLVFAAVLHASIATNLVEYLSDYTALWMCHEYEAEQDDLWCATAGFEAGFEYAFSPSPGVSFCLPCMCCKRNAIHVTTSADPLADPLIYGTTTTLAPSTTRKHNRVEKHPLAISGLTNSESMLLAGGGGGVVEGGRLTLKHNSGFTLFSKFEDEFEPDNFVQLKLLGKEMSFDVDLSRVGCACNVALYFIAAPGRDLNGEYWRGPKNSGQPPYYCDANKVGGQWCPEVDIMEANDHAFAATPHKCEAPKNGHYSSCERDGCSHNTRDVPVSYGPGAEYAIDTRRPFHVRTQFPEDGGVLTGMITTLSQAGHEVLLNHSLCKAKDLAALSGAMSDGMSLRITYWGESAETMSWLDAPPCGRQACNATAGAAVIANISMHRLPEEVHVHKLPISIDGLAPGLLAGGGDTGGGGSISDNSLTLRHNSGFTLFSNYEDKWEPDNMEQMKLLGKVLTFEVDLSAAGCACNVALYLISAPGRGLDGRPYVGPENSGQPAYYCDANKVGGQWCPEVDIMEANTHAFASTPHKCDEPKNGHYSRCDREGCSQNTRDEPQAYGPGSTYTIDTRQPFKVETEFPEEGGKLAGMITTLRQGPRKLVLNHTGCDKDLAALTGAMADGMSLRITYWGDSAETMAWMDAPVCGLHQACSGANAGDVLISKLAIESYMWVITDPQDELFGHEVPKDVVENEWMFTHMGGLGVANWNGGTHYARRQRRPSSPEAPHGSKDCGEGAAWPCDESAREGGFANLVVKKFLALPGTGSGKEQHSGSTAASAIGHLTDSPADSGASIPMLLAACLFGVAFTLGAMRIYPRGRRWHRRKSSQPDADVAGAAATSAAAVVDGAQPGLSRVESGGSDLGLGGHGLRDGLEFSPARERTGSNRMPMLTRKTSSCQHLLTLAEADV